MSASSRLAITDQNPALVPLYSPWDVARYLHVPIWSVLAMLGRSHPDPEWFFHIFRRWVPPFAAVDEHLEFPGAGDRVTFQRLADLYIRAFTVHCLAELTQTEPMPSGRWEAFHKAAWRVLDNHRPAPTFFGQTSPAEGIARLVESIAEGSLSEKREWLEKRLLLCLDRVELTEGLPSRLYPFSRVPAEGSPRTIVIDPRTRFGRPTIAGRGLPTDILFERHQAGDSIAEIVEDYSLTTVELEEALRYEAMSSVQIFLFPGW